MNVRNDETRTFEQLHFNIKHFKLESLNKVPNKAFLIVEDIVFMTGKQELGLRHCLNYDSHHKSIKLFCVSHTIHKTKIFSMLPLYHFIVFTSGKSNVPVLRFTFDFFKIDKETRDWWLQEFGRLGRQGLYFIFDCASVGFYWSCDFLRTCFPLTDRRFCEPAASVRYEDSPANGREQTVKRFEKFVEGHPNKAKARALFSVCARSTAKIDPYDFTVAFAARSGPAKKVSVVDYIHSLLSERDSGDTDLSVLHKYFTEKHSCVFPKSFIANPRYAAKELKKNGSPLEQENAIYRRERAKS